MAELFGLTHGCEAIHDHACCSRRCDTRWTIFDYDATTRWRSKECRSMQEQIGCRLRTHDVLGAEEATIYEWQ
jgi:hypothetical protein